MAKSAAWGRGCVIVALWQWGACPIVSAAPDRFVLTSWNDHNVFSCELDGSCTELAPAGAGGLTRGHSVTVGPEGLLYVVSLANHSVLRFNPTTGDFVDVFIASGLGALSNPTEIVFGPADGIAYVTSFGNNRVKMYDPDTGAYLGNRVNAANAGGLSGPESLMFGPDGHLYVSSRFTHSIKKYDGSTGAYLGDFVTPGLGGLSEPFHMEFSADGALFWVGSSTGDTVIEYDGVTGALIRVLVEDDPLTPEDETGGLDNPHDVTIGPDGRMYVTSFDSDEILVYDTATGAFLLAIAGPDGPQEVEFITDGFVEPDVRVLHTFTGESVGDQFGWVSSKIGDLDGDTLPDLLITAPTNDAGGNNAGRVYAYSSNPASDPGAPLLTITGTLPNGQFGNNVGAAGDANGDGVPDLLVGAPFTPNGDVYLHSGADGALVDQITGFAPGDQFGQAVCPGLDHNGDGIQEILVGAPGADPGTRINAGRFYIFDGATRALIGSVAGENAGDSFGSTIAPIADQNGDGVPDVLVGAPNANPNGNGRMYLYSGADLQLLCSRDPVGPAVGLGSHFLSSPGDTNNNGRDDIHVTDWQHAGGRGRLYVFEYDGSQCVELFRLTGPAGSSLGIGNGTAGDVSFDGHDDILTGLWTAGNGAPNAGAAHIFSGSDQSLYRTITSTTAGEALGFDAHTVCDVSGNGVDDMLLTAANFNASQGRVYLIEGVRAGPPCPADLAPPLGVLNVDDIDAFVVAFLAGDPVADLDGNAVINLDDLDAFVASFLAGCP